MPDPGLQIDTPTVRRLRDRLLDESGPAPAREPIPCAEALTSAQQAALDRIAPLAEVLFLTIAADGELQRSECQAIRGAIDRLTEDLLPEPAVADFLTELETRLESQGRETRLEFLASSFALDKPGAEVAFSLAAAVALSDGELDETERVLIGDMRKYFGIPEPRAAALLEGATPRRR